MNLSSKNFLRRTATVNVEVEPGPPGPAGADGADGIDGANFAIAGTWNPASVTYSIYDVVEFNGSSYLCAANHTSGPGTVPTAGLPWQLLAAKGETGETGEVGADGPQGVDGVSIVWRGPWADATGYAPNNAVEHNGSSYICTDAHNSTSGTEPGVGMDWETVWDLMAAGV